MLRQQLLSQQACSTNNRTKRNQEVALCAVGCYYDWRFISPLEFAS